MPIRINPEDFLALPFTVFDVRSPVEYEKGHIVNAINLPLFSNEERALVGTAYFKKGREEAIRIGIEKVRSKLITFIENVKNTSKGKQIRLHCWRGGMRSDNMARLLETAGYEVYILEGGYKSYRQYARKYFDKPFSLIVLDGMTGTGKTEILYYLKNNGQQVIDLEELARHKGSVFGHLGQPKQPSSEHFENLLFDQLYNFSYDKPVWTEAESLSIGKVYIPSSFFYQVQKAPTVLLERDIALRTERLVKEYAHFDKELLIHSVQCIARRIGNDNALVITNLIQQSNFRNAVLGLLKYYDKLYKKNLKKDRSRYIGKLIINDLSGQEIINKLLHLSQNFSNGKH